MSYIIKQISNRYACDLAVQFGYSGRRPNAIVSFALVDKTTGVVVGSVVYGNTSSPTVSQICGVDESDNVYSVNSLWLKKGIAKKYELALLKRTLSKLDKEIVIAYCDTEQFNMIDIFNKASFIYLGLTDERTDRGYVGEFKNTLFGKVLVKQNKHNLSAWYDKENTVEVIRKQKHRYVFFNCGKERFGLLYDQLKYTEKPKPNP